MNNFLDIVDCCPLFRGISTDELQKLLACLSAVEKHYKKNNFVFIAGDNVTSLGIVLSGCVHVVQEDFWGNRTILTAIETGGMFGEAFSCAEIEKFPVSVMAIRPSDILLLDYKKIATLCSSACAYHSVLIKNMLQILANKNVMLTKKIESLTKRTTREKLLSYLSFEAQRAGRNKFIIPYNRQELAEYLSVDRSAMSNELSKMRDEGILSFERSKFELYKTY